MEKTFENGAKIKLVENGIGYAIYEIFNGEVTFYLSEIYLLTKGYLDMFDTLDKFLSYHTSHNHFSKFFATLQTAHLYWKEYKWKTSLV